MQTYLVTGGTGFIGSNFILKARREDWATVINLDKLTYASHPQTLASLSDDAGYQFVQGDIGDPNLVRTLLNQYQPDAILNFAAESHVDRSILSPQDFIQTNVVGTFHLLEASRVYWEQLAVERKAQFRFLHVSTDEVYGSLNPTDPAFREDTPYAPNSPYAASKAGSDHLVRAYHHTYGLPTLTTHCSNNYGPRQFPEKLIPLIILNALDGKPLPIYGDGQNVRDWLYVSDHCDAIERVLRHSLVGETYNIGGRNELTNLAVVEQICSILDDLAPKPNFNHSSLITFIQDRPGHDRRYAIDCSKIQRDLGWQPAESFESGLLKTVQWYLANARWIEQVRSGAYQSWITQNYCDRAVKSPLQASVETPP
ncbi:dTDP-glucose 4,6-dehydratase [Myxacorys almedinensis]|uniref:dTDP-glucose 4,6-dehydratase n=1 Tax=Myxacorys almedinensis A TaxID=2690445 RepID=A0A8J7Z414_9CYAN|nr:dTDP-glucose 4,6-dehydratase [Myxacorys almedinensis]NDJ19589.1 dTDP-glucose 4,6-dehydratase [Myxacorys almedinensis A]